MGKAAWKRWRTVKYEESNGGKERGDGRLEREVKNDVESIYSTTIHKV